MPNSLRLSLFALAHSEKEREEYFDFDRLEKSSKQKTAFLFSQI